ncbi:hypothetical protein A130_01090 [Vibrio genomosp. F6 str. FF-238]|uniref:Uncharacterized protein n=1 Tax=Vibrio genomosp. F6 str. FF-238 TaxID=1191298 RepID=A0A1E5CPI1_9VIBR|nr:hypothetical protein A130_01090 [Vibrio genomosp. F6 str. FF-238]
MDSPVLMIRYKNWLTRYDNAKAAIIDRDHIKIIWNWKVPPSAPLLILRYKNVQYLNDTYFNY